MKLPVGIKRKLVSANNHARAMAKLMSEVDGYLENKGFSSEELRSGNGRSLEEFEYGNGNIDNFEAYLTEIEENKTNI